MNNLKKRRNIIETNKRNLSSSVRKPIKNTTEGTSVCQYKSPEKSIKFRLENKNQSLSTFPSSILSDNRPKQSNSSEFFHSRHKISKSSTHGSPDYSSLKQKKTDTQTEDGKDCLSTKTPHSSEAFQEKDPDQKDDILDIKVKIELLTKKLTQNEEDARGYKIENQNLKRTIQDLEHRLDEFQLYNKISMTNCSSKCVVS